MAKKLSLSGFWPFIIVKMVKIQVVVTNAQTIILHNRGLL